MVENVLGKVSSFFSLIVLASSILIDWRHPFGIEYNHFVIES